MSTFGGQRIPMGTFSVVVLFNVGDMGDSEAEAEAVRRQMERAEEALRPESAALKKAVDHYLRGDHEYRYLLDQILPVAPTDADRQRTISLPNYRNRLIAWLHAEDRLLPDWFYFELMSREELPRWQQEKIAANFCLRHLGPGGYLRDWETSPQGYDSVYGSGSGPFALQLAWGATRDPSFSNHAIPDPLWRSVLDGRKLPDEMAAEFDAANDPEQAWRFATTVWMFARDEDLGPWKARCLEQSVRKFPQWPCIPEWARADGS
jgi:hypothetical protein